MKIVYSSESRIYCLEGGKKTEIPCERSAKYRQTVDSIRRRNEWKTTGRGAQFQGTMKEYEDSSDVYVDMQGLCGYDGRLIYSLTLDGSSCLYHRGADRSENDEGLIISSNTLYFGGVDYYDGKLAASMGHTPDERHIALFDPPSPIYNEYTDGDSQETAPYFSRSVKGRLYFSTCGNARGDHGGVTAVSNRTGAYIDTNTSEMTELLSDEKYDFLSLKDDSDGNLYYIRQPYHTAKPEKFRISDVFFFPFRLIKALGGWLNFMSVIWGGESLNGKTPDDMIGERAGRRSRRDLIIDGNIIKAEHLADKNGREEPLLPAERVLIKREPDGAETVVAKGVLDYAVTPDGEIVRSDGRYIIMPGGEKVKAHLARNLTVL